MATCLPRCSAVSADTPLCGALSAVGSVIGTGLAGKCAASGNEQAPLNLAVLKKIVLAWVRHPGLKLNIPP